MYTLVSAIGVEKGLNKRWKNLNLISVSLADIFSTYRKVYLRLSIGSPITYCYFDLDKLKISHQNSIITINDFLLQNGNTTLDTVTNAPNINTKTIKFKDAYKANYSITPYHRTYGINVPIDQRDSILLTRTQPITDYNLFYNKCLVTINGFCHMTDTNGNNGVLVYDAMKSLNISKQNQIGIISFYDLCNIKLVPITLPMLTKHNTNEAYSSSMYINVPNNIDLNNKTVFISIGGYLHTHDSNLFTRVSTNEFKIDFLNYPLLDRFYECNRYIDLTSLNLPTSINNHNQINVDDLKSDLILSKLMTLSQSFLIILDCPEIYIQKQYIRNTNLPGMYISYIEPKFPLVTGLGRMPEYWSTYEDTQYSITCYDNLTSNMIYSTIKNLELTNVSNSQLPVNPEIYSGAYFIEIGRDI